MESVHSVFEESIKLIIDIVKHLGWDTLIFHSNNFAICLENLIGRGSKIIPSVWRGWQKIYSMRGRGGANQLIRGGRGCHI